MDKQFAVFKVLCIQVVATFAARANIILLHFFFFSQSYHIPNVQHWLFLQAQTMDHTIPGCDLEETAMLFYLD